MWRTPFKAAVAAAALFLSVPALAGRSAPSPDPGFRRQCVVVLDPGHGGDDRGAVGPTGLLEKTVAFGVAEEAARVINEDGSCRALLTRSSDVFIPLEERTAFANMADADLFISIHANSAPSMGRGGRGSRGIETYFLSLDATDEDARLLAEAENSSGARAASSPRQDEDLAVIMDDLTDTVAHHASSVLAETMQARLVAAVRRGDRGVKQANFTVLAGASMPAVLVEVGFISNPSEERMLSSEAGRVKISRAIADAAIEFNRSLWSGDELRASNKD